MLSCYGINSNNTELPFFYNNNNLNVRCSEVPRISNDTVEIFKEVITSIVNENIVDLN